MLNEMLANITSIIKSFPDFKGLQSLVLRFFSNLEDPLDEKILASFADLCTNLKVLVVSMMNYLSEEGRVQWVVFATNLIENNESDMTTINIEEMASSRGVTS